MTSPTLMPEPTAADSGTPPAPAAAAPRRGRVVVPVILFFVTLLSTTSVGMRYMFNFHLGNPPLSSDADILPYEWVLHHLSGFASGLPFSLTLIAILLAHEFGHYFACRAYGVNASLPYLLPAPSLSGSFGAVIALKSRVRSRAALITIGAMGPIAGFVVAIGAVAVGLSLSHYAPYATTLSQHVQAPLLVHALHTLIGSTSALDRLIPHPVLVASWMGMLITALNLIPAGQLDGGHILYSISPAAHKVSHRLVIVALLAMGIFFWCGWLLWALILMMPAMRHPKVAEDGNIQPYHFALFPICAVILLLSATYAPFQGFSLLDFATKLPHH
jgi:Zn-dependent protease